MHLNVIQYGTSMEIVSNHSSRIDQMLKKLQNSSRTESTYIIWRKKGWMEGIFCATSSSMTEHERGDGVNDVTYVMKNLDRFPNDHKIIPDSTFIKRALS